MDSIKSSFTAASSIPIKILQNVNLLSYLRDGFIPPVHVQLIPTNICNLNCSFCSCASRDKATELNFSKVVSAMRKFVSYGCKSVTITGGGEPLMYREINELVKILTEDLGLKIGIVTNGTRFQKFSAYDSLVWCRISASDEREPDWESIESGIGQGSGVDWAFSYVMTASPNWQRLQRVVDFANDNKFTHVRLVSDLLDVEAAAANIQNAKGKLENDQLVIYQDRAVHTRGRKQCHISLLKPLIGADGGLYPCCGIQYAYDPPSKDLSKAHRMGNMAEIGQIWESQRAYDGSKCVTCYYDDYNYLIDTLRIKLKHKEFV